MSRRPKLIKGNLYYIKMRDVLVNNNKLETHEYIAEIINLEPADQNKLCVLLSILASTQDEDYSELKRASTGYLQTDGTYKRPLTINYMGPFNAGGEYLWERAAFIQLKGRSPTWMRNAVIKYYDPRNLPLYLNWSFGLDWISQQLKKAA